MNNKSIVLLALCYLTPSPPVFTVGCCSLPTLLNRGNVPERDILSRSLKPRFTHTQDSAMHAHLLNTDPQTLLPSPQVQKFWRPKVFFTPLAAKPAWPGGQLYPLLFPHRLRTLTCFTQTHHGG